MTVLRIRGGRVIDPVQKLDQIADVWIVNGRIAAIERTDKNPAEHFERRLETVVAAAASSPSDSIIDAQGLIVAPGFVELHASFREPGDEEDETTETGTAAALAGGFTSVACLPDTSPPIDNRAAAEFVQRQAERAGNCHVFPMGAITKNLAGEELAEIGQLCEGGAVAFTDAPRPMANAEIMRRALQYTRMFNRPIFNRPQVPELVAGGIMHEGYHSTLLGFRGMPAAAEEIMVSRDIALAELTGGRLHLVSISTRGAVEQVARAKQRGVLVTCDVAAHQLCLTDETMAQFDPNFKVDPPLRTREHIDALIQGLADGTIDAISSDHQPYAEERKNLEMDLAPFGIAGLETVLPICVRELIETSRLDWPRLIERLTAGPARVLGIDKGTLRVGVGADIALIDPSLNWTIDPNAFQSSARNTPFGGWNVRGAPVMVIVDGEIRYRRTPSPVSTT